LALDWSGKGNFANVEHTGEAKLDIRKARYGDIAISEGKLSGMYFPATADFSEFHVVSNEGTLDAAIQIEEGKLRFRDIKFQRGGETLTGFVIVPIDLAKHEKPSPLFPLDQRIAAVLNATNLDIEKVL